MSRVQKFFKVFGWALFFASAYLLFAVGIVVVLETFRGWFGFVGAIVAFVLLVCTAVALIGSASSK